MKESTNGIEVHKKEAEEEQRKKEEEDGGAQELMSYSLDQQ